MSKYQVMPAAGAGEDAELLADIRQRGLIYPIVTDEKGNIIDGHRRKAACDAAGISYESIVQAGLTDQQKIELAYALNLQRRQLTREQREQLWIAMRKDGMSYRQIAEADGTVSQQTVMRSIVPDGTVDLPDTVTGKDGKKRKAKADGKAAAKPQKPAKQEPATLVWTDAVERVLGDLRGISRNNLTQTKAGWKPAIEAQLGKAIPNRVAFPSPEASAIAEAFLWVLAEKRPAGAAEDAAARAAEARQALPKTAQEKLDAAIRAAKRVLELEFEARVQERMTALLEETFLPRYRIEHERYVKFNAAYKGALKREDYKRLLQFLHPDKFDRLGKHADDMKEKAAALFDLIKSSEEVLCGPATKPLSGAVPETVAELLARRRNRGDANGR